MRGRPATRQLAATAARAWEMLTRAEDPMPVEAAVDWCRIESGCEDVPAVKRALYAAAGRWMRSYHNATSWQHLNDLIGRGDAQQAELYIRSFGPPANWEESKRPEVAEWLRRGTRAASFCRAIEGQPE